MTSILSENDGFHNKSEDIRSLMKETYRSDAVVPPYCPPHWCSAEARERREDILPERSRAHVYTALSLLCYCVLHHLQPSCFMNVLPKVLLATLMIERPLRWMSEIIFRILALAYDTNVTVYLQAHLLLLL